MASPALNDRRAEQVGAASYETLTFSDGDTPVGYAAVTQYGGDSWVQSLDAMPGSEGAVRSALEAELDGDVYYPNPSIDGPVKRSPAADYPEGMSSPGIHNIKRLFSLSKPQPTPEKKKEVERSLLEKPPAPVQGIPDYAGIELTDVKAAGGSNGARIAVDSNGNSWLLKAYRGNSDRVATELLANALYRELGVTVSNAGVGTSVHPQFGPQKAVAYPLVAGDLRKWNKPDPDLAEGFVADALLANWDVIGLDQDNVLWNGDTPIRLDQGGTLEYRAMGQNKTFGPVPSEMWTMRDERGQANGRMAITEAGMLAQARDAALRLTPERIDELVDEAPFDDEEMRERVRQALKDRVSWLDRYSRGLEKMPEPLQEQEITDYFLDRDQTLETMPSEDAAIEAFYGDLRTEIDDQLQKQRAKEQASPEVRTAITELDMVLSLDETKLDEAITVHVPLPSVDNPDGLVGTWVTERSYLPAQTMPDTMSPASVRLKVPAGANALMPAAINLDAPEAEVLLPRNSRIKITGIEENENGTLRLDAVLKPAPAYKPAKPKSMKPIASPQPSPQPPMAQGEMFPGEGEAWKKGMSSPGADRGSLIKERVKETMGLWGPEAEANARDIVEQRLTENPNLDTETHFVDADGTYIPERTVLHKQQLDFIRGDSQPVPEGETPKAVFMSGGSAAGKGTLLGEGVIEQPDDIVHVDADEFKELIPEYQALKEMGEDESIEEVDIADAAPIVHEESSYLSKVASADAIATRRNVLIDAVGGSASYMRRIEQARDAGHDVEVNLVVNDPDRAFEQAAKRAEETGRSVPLFQIYGSHRNVARTFDQEWYDEDSDGEIVGEPHKPLTQRGVPGKIYDGRTRALIATWDADGTVTVLDQAAYDEWRGIASRPHPAKDPEMPARNARAAELLEKAKKRKALAQEQEMAMASPPAFSQAADSGIKVGANTQMGERAPELVEVADAEIARMAERWPGLQDVAFYLIDDEQTQMMEGLPGQPSPESFVLTSQGNPFPMGGEQWSPEDLTPAAFAKRGLYRLDGGRGGKRSVLPLSFQTKHGTTVNGDRVGLAAKPHTIILSPTLLGESTRHTVGGKVLAARTGQKLEGGTIIDGKPWREWLNEASARLSGTGGDQWKKLWQFGSRVVTGNWKQDTLDLSESDFPATREDLAAMFQTTVTHEIGHAVGAEIVGAKHDAKAYQAMFEDYGITPEEIQQVSYYATSHPSEAFAEIYSLLFSELADKMNPALREKFINLLRDKMPNHEVPQTMAELAATATMAE